MPIVLAKLGRYLAHNRMVHHGGLDEAVGFDGIVDMLRVCSF
jgi:hypothetical protein